MEKKSTDRFFQESLLGVWEKKFVQIKQQQNQIVEAKNILEDMKTSLTAYHFDEDIIDTLSNLVDRIMNTLNAASCSRLYGDTQNIYAW